MVSCSTVSVLTKTLKDRIERVIVENDAPYAVAKEVADHLVRAERSGHASHGVLRISDYVRKISCGLLMPSALPTEVSSTPASSVFDGHFGFGHYAAAVAAERVISLGDRSGFGVTTLRNTNHIGRLGEYAERIAGKGLIGIIALGSAGPGIGAMRPFGVSAGEPFMNTNPWCIGIPADPGPVVFDASMSSVAEGKIHAARDRGGLLPDGAIINAEGNPSNDPADYYAGGSLMPLGGQIAGHKGIGMALIAALLGGLASADGTAPMLRGIGSVRHNDGADDSLGGITMIAIDPALSGDRTVYANRVSRTVSSLRSTGALVPGDMERDCRAANTDYVSLSNATLDGLVALESSFGA